MNLPGRINGHCPQRLFHGKRLLLCHRVALPGAAHHRRTWEGDPAADEAAFHPPYNDLGAISSGWITTGKFYHSTADVDWGAINFEQMGKISRAHAYIIDELFKLEKADLHRGGHPAPEKSVYQSDLLKMIMGNN